MIRQLRDVVFGTRCLLGQIGGIQTAQDVLKNGQCWLGAGQFVQRIRCAHPFVGTGVTVVARGDKAGRGSDSSLRRGGAACSSVRPSWTSRTSVPPSTGVSVHVLRTWPLAQLHLSSCRLRCA
jgi:hypothetical protein